MIPMNIIGTPLFQWETGRQLQIIPLQNMTISAVHFSNPGDLEALVVEPKEVDGKIVADIPNILLQKGSNIVVYSVNVSADCVETLRDCIFPVRKRPKPSDYVYTETEILNYSSLSKRIDDMEGEGLAKAVEAYLEENPVDGTSDWNAAEGEPGHILNRTHWTEGGNVEILPETSMLVDEGDGTFYTTGNIPLVDGAEITVSWNGTHYKCGTYAFTQDTESGEIVAFGNSEVLAEIAGMETEENTAPFVGLYSAHVSFLMMVPLDESSAATVAIYSAVGKVHQLDNKYLNLDWLPVRTHAKGEIVAERTGPANNYFGTAWFGQATPYNVTPGKYYFVVWNGDEYRVQFEPGTGEYVYGRFRSDAFEITYIYDSSEVPSLRYGFRCRPLDGSTEVALSIYEDVAVPNKIPDEFLPDDFGGINITGASIGQIARISAVDAEGKPTAWEPIDLPDSGGNVDLTGVVKSVNGKTPDENGNVEITVSGSGGSLNIRDMEVNEIFIIAGSNPDEPGEDEPSTGVVATNGRIIDIDMRNVQATDEYLTDTSGNENHMKLSAVGSQSADGIWNPSFFDTAANKSVGVAAYTENTIDFSGDFTVELLCDVGGANRHQFATGVPGWTGKDNTWTISGQNSDGTIYNVRSQLITQPGNYSLSHSFSNDIFKSGTFYHIVIVRSGSDVSFYANGVFIETFVQEKEIPLNHRCYLNVYLQDVNADGTVNKGTGIATKYKMFRAYTRALSASEIANHYSIELAKG